MREAGHFIICAFLQPEDEVGLRFISAGICIRRFLQLQPVPSGIIPVYDLISDLGLPCTVHTGFDPFSPNHLHASPEKVMKIHTLFPRLRLILAHLGGLLEWEGGETLAGEGMMMDTAMVSVGLPPETAARIIRKNGAENVLMGSDMPWATTKEAVDYIQSLPLTDREKELIMGENAARLLGIEQL